MVLSEIFLAHGSGLDEMAIILFPVIVGVGVWVMTRQPNRPDKNGGTSSDPEA